MAIGSEYAGVTGRRQKLRGPPCMEYRLCNVPPYDVFREIKSHSAAETRDPLSCRFSADVQQADTVQCRKPCAAAKAQVIAASTDKFFYFSDPVSAKRLNFVRSPPAWNKKKFVLSKNTFPDISGTNQLKGQAVGLQCPVCHQTPEK